MRMKPAINFYRGLADLLDHSWEGVKYGSLSRQKFMSLALSPTVQNIPFVDKGGTRFIPGEYPVSLGSVGVNTSDIAIRSASDGSYMYVNWDSLAGFEGVGSFASDTWGVVSAQIIAANPALHDGDEITLIVVTENNGFYIPRHSYLVLDTASSLTVLTVFNSAGFIVNTSGLLSFVVKDSYDAEGDVFTFADTNIVAAAIIVSRHPSRTSTTWLRSTSTMVVSDTFKALWMSTDRYAAALLTYQDSATELTSDWLLNQAGSASGNAGSGDSGGLIQNFTLENREVTGVGESASSLCAYYNDGTNEGFICDSYIPVENPAGTQTVGYSATNPYNLQNRSVVSAGDIMFPPTVKVLSLSANTSVRTKIAQFYTFQ